eukprot:1161030-Pelagomonas_calceolata.AAC.5
MQAKSASAWISMYHSLKGKRKGRAPKIQSNTMTCVAFAHDATSEAQIMMKPDKLVTHRRGFDNGSLGLNREAPPAAGAASALAVLIRQVPQGLPNAGPRASLHKGTDLLHTAQCSFE